MNINFLFIWFNVLISLKRIDSRYAKCTCGRSDEKVLLRCVNGLIRPNSYSTCADPPHRVVLLNIFDTNFPRIQYREIFPEADEIRFTLTKTACEQLCRSPTVTDYRGRPLLIGDCHCFSGLSSSNFDQTIINKPSSIIGSTSISVPLPSASTFTYAPVTFVEVVSKRESTNHRYDDKTTKSFAAAADSSTRIVRNEDHLRDRTSKSSTVLAETVAGSVVAFIICACLTCTALKLQRRFPNVAVRILETVRDPLFRYQIRMFAERLIQAPLTPFRLLFRAFDRRNDNAGALDNINRSDSTAVAPAANGSFSSTNVAAADDNNRSNDDSTKTTPKRRAPPPPPPFVNFSFSSTSPPISPVSTSSTITTTAATPLDEFSSVYRTPSTTNDETKMENFSNNDQLARLTSETSTTAATVPFQPTIFTREEGDGPATATKSKNENRISEDETQPEIHRTHNYIERENQLRLENLQMRSLLEEARIEMGDKDNKIRHLKDAYRLTRERVGPNCNTTFLSSDFEFSSTSVQLDSSETANVIDETAANVIVEMNANRVDSIQAPPFVSSSSSSNIDNQQQQQQTPITATTNTDESFQGREAGATASADSQSPGSIIEFVPPIGNASSTPLLSSGSVSNVASAILDASPPSRLNELVNSLKSIFSISENNNSTAIDDIDSTMREINRIDAETDDNARQRDETLDENDDDDDDDCENRTLTPRPTNEHVELISAAAAAGTENDTILVTTTVNQVQQLLYSTAGANVSISPLIRKLMIGFIMKNGGSFRFEAATLNKANSQSLLLYFSQYAAEKYGPSDYADTPISYTMADELTLKRLIKRS